LGGLHPNESGKAIIFGQTLKLFFGQKPAAKNEKKPLLNAKTEFIPFSAKCPKSGILLIILGGVSRSGKAILQVSIAAFFTALSKYSSGKDGSAP